MFCALAVILGPEELATIPQGVGAPLHHRPGTGVLHPCQLLGEGNAPVCPPLLHTPYVGRYM